MPCSTKQKPISLLDWEYLTKRYGESMTRNVLVKSVMN